MTWNIFTIVINSIILATRKASCCKENILVTDIPRFMLNHTKSLAISRGARHTFSFELIDKQQIIKETEYTHPVHTCKMLRMIEVLNKTNSVEKYYMNVRYAKVTIKNQCIYAIL